MKSKRQINVEWDNYVKNLIAETPVPVETQIEKIARIKKLEADPMEWFKYHFPNYAYADFAPFHTQSTKRFLKNLTTYETRAWSRELAKSTMLMMQVLFGGLVQKSIRNVLHISHNYDNSEDLLTPYKLNLEHNQRLIHDYGDQRSLTKWEAGHFVTKSGISFRAIGAKQSARGKKNEHSRPDCVIFDDVDTDEICRNRELVKKLWKKIERNVIPALSVSGNKRIIFNGNIIGKYCIIKEAIKKSDYYEIINIRDKHGKSSWSAKNSEADINYMLSKMSYASAQQEYFNNPIQEGTVFKEITWGKVPNLGSCRLMVRYGDPAPSNREAKGGSLKAVVEIIEKDGYFYIHKVRLKNTSNYQFIDWYHELDEYTAAKITAYNYMENNSLQDPFYEQVYRPLMLNVNKKRSKSLFVLPDGRKKPDKFVRIEGNLEPLNRFGKLIFNIKEKNNPHMIRLVEQFEAVEPKLGVDVDGVDAVEGGIWILQNKLKEFAPIKVGKHTRSRSKHF